ncbi:hypothetical protein [Aquimarina aggregata]|uniref:hypothetical protein n=1 Tax=Aquimarina aggregata TaxID=1642818 RepID=UPI00248F8354|nr:hypothetical protein [Aquimarina aggregata]
MITSKERAKLKKQLGPRYTKGVLEILKKQSVTSPNGESYTSSSIRNVLAGNMKNEAIENAIYDYATQEREKTERLAKKRKELLK